MNLIFTCGGTAGHINPAIAVADMMRQRHPEANILFIGATGHMEESLVPQAGYEVRCLPGSGLSRGKNLAAVKQNIRAVKCVLDAVKVCKSIFKEFQPDAVIGTGGYASFPALYAAQSMGIPTCVHESNALPGVTTKLAASRASRVLVAFEESTRHYKHPERVEVVGMPVRQEFLYETKAEARKKLGLEGHVVVSAFGSQGAKVMNETMADMMALEKKDSFPFHHIHATGSFGKEWMPKRVKANGVDYESCPALDIREYIYNMPDVMAAADVMIGRAGSATCNEIAAAGVPCILVPSPNVTGNHQEKNARVLEGAGGAVVILERDCTPQGMYDKLRQLLDDEQGREQMSRRLHSMVRLDSTQRICGIVEELTKR
ncbi:MAG: UDP-N-acetylglucosamine--N-acetylmuramyl-(pentapeptide) pyrophosphoryl-undecaprenol N-acetylglucosamine transferase [Eubacteriales bacterium]|nr:UDP-N-acetylglucosamine--N-acetylmuramyl-(pentapeptide) pyrophosphoryl-undecaprenol N-acetylglucosamine transferase [Eubacteriales bacterium]